jgi:hypothetical protein
MDCFAPDARGAARRRYAQPAQPRAEMDCFAPDTRAPARCPTTLDRAVQKLATHLGMAA